MRLIRIALFACFLLLHIDGAAEMSFKTTASRTKHATLTRVTTQCPEMRVSCPSRGCVIKSTKGDDGCPQYYCECKDATTTRRTTTTESTSTFETPTTTATTPEIVYDCFPPCDWVEVTDVFGHSEYICDCTTTPTSVTSPPIYTTPSCPDFSTSCDVYPCQLINTYRYDSKGCLVFDCVCHTTTEEITTECPQTTIECYPECFLMTTIAPDGCQVNQCACPEITEITETQTPTTTSPCPEMMLSCDGNGSPCERIEYIGVDNFGCRIYKCICPTPTDTSSSDITTTPLVTCPASAVVCSPECELYSSPGINGCPVYECFCPTSSGDITTSEITTKPLVTCLESFIQCSPGCNPFSGYGPDGCPVYQCCTTTPEKTSTSTEPTITTWTTPPPCPEVFCPQYCENTTRPDGCPFCDCSDTITLTEPTETTSPLCPEVTCPRGCSHVIHPNGCPGCNCAQTTTTTSTTTITTTTTDDGCDDGCEKVMGHDGYHSCQCPKTCKDIECKSFEECILQEVFCTKAPCFPVPTCAKRCDSCLAKPARKRCGEIKSQRWTYDPECNICKKFSYYGCIPSPNTYKTRQQCVSECQSKAPFCRPCGPKCYTLRRPGGCPKCICPNPCKKLKCPKEKTCKLHERNCLKKPCPRPRPYCA